MTDSRETTIQLLGEFRVKRAADVLLDSGWNRRKALALLKLVAVQPDGQLHRDRAFEVRWPALDPRAETNSRHKNLHYLSAALNAEAERRDPLELSGGDLAAIDLDELEVPAPPRTPRPVTYGRDRELEIIEGAFDEALAGRGAVLFLIGEARIGKSHLLQHIEAAGAEQRALVRSCPGVVAATEG